MKNGSPYGAISEVLLTGWLSGHSSAAESAPKNNDSADDDARESISLPQEVRGRGPANVPPQNAPFLQRIGTGSCDKVAKKRPLSCGSGGFRNKIGEWCRS